MRSALDDEILVPHKTTSVSGAWHRTAGWLKKLAKSKTVVAAKIAKSLILSYRHPSPDYLAAPKQKASFQALKNWRG